MQNFRKHSNRRQSLAGIDGFLRSTQPPDKLPRPQVNFNQAYRPDVTKNVARNRPRRAPSQQTKAQPQAVDFFQRRDGYHSSNAVIGAPAVSAATTVELPSQNLHSPKKRWHFKSFKIRNKRWLKITLRTTAAMAVFAVLIGGFLFGKGYFKARQIFKGDGSASAAALEKTVDPAKLNGEGDGRVNILLLGKGGPSHEGGDLTDSILLVSIDPVQNEAALLSVPRDLYVKVPDEGSMKINAVYSLGKQAARRDGEKDDLAIERSGIEMAEKAVEEVLGVPVHYYAMVDFDAFRKAIDTVGGIDVDVKKAVYDTNFAWQFGVLNVKPGLQNMNGATALMYARSRYTSERGDFDRTERQREIMVALKNKVLSLGTFSNPLKISQLISDFGDNVSTNLKLEELKRLYDIGSAIDSSKVASIGLADPPNNYLTTGYIGDQSVVMPRAGLFTYKEIQAFVRNSLRDSFLKNENATVVVLNGAGTAGLATEKSDELKSYGYNVTKIADAPTSDYATTILVDRTNGLKKYTKSYLEKRYGVQAVTSLPMGVIDDTNADFVIILGKNETLSNQN